MPLLCVEVKGQYFGRNKPRYRSFHFKVVEISHFRLYHYLEHQEVVVDFIRDAERYGGSTDKNYWYPLYIGNPYSIRGYDSRSARNNLTQNGNYVHQLVGSKMLVGNIELRVPFSGPKTLCLFESDYLLTDLNFFIDGGMAYTSGLPVSTDEAGKWILQFVLKISSYFTCRILIGMYIDINFAMMDSMHQIM